jgi:predicted nucleic acid-binding protein
MLVVYSALNAHPAGPPCEQFLKAHTGWFTSPLVLIEAHAVLTKVYSVDPVASRQTLAQLLNVPITLIDLNVADALTAFQLAEAHQLDVTDAVLLELGRSHGATYMATDDQHLAQACRLVGITPVSPIDSSLRQAIAAWEAVNVAPRGLPRFLRRIYQWLGHYHVQAAQDFWSCSGGGSHLP